MKIHVLQCGSIRVDPTVPFGKRLDLIETAKQLTAADRNRITLPVFTYLIEHPKGLILVDTGWCREISPDGVYDPKAAAAVLPSQMAALFHPFVPKGMAIHEQLAGMGIQPEDLDYVLLTHLDVDHVAGLRHVSKAKHIVLPEYEYYWSCRTVYKIRQPQDLWIQYPMERPYYRGSSLGPNHWVIDLFGDESVQLVNVPGHTEGQAAIMIRNGGRFVLLTADAAFSPRNWQEMIVPGFGFARDFQRKSLRWIAEMATDPNCAAVLCSHDPEVKPGVIEIKAEYSSFIFPPSHCSHFGMTSSKNLRLEVSITKKYMANKAYIPVMGLLYGVAKCRRPCIFRGYSKTGGSPTGFVRHVLLRIYYHKGRVPKSAQKHPFSPFLKERIVCAAKKGFYTSFFRYLSLLSVFPLTPQREGRAFQPFPFVE